MSVTMRDVAREAGVSIRTVSRVVNNLGEISEPTRQRVLAVIEELGYRPNVLARGLVSGKTLLLAVIIPRITDPFFPDFVLGVESVARNEGYSLLLCNTNDDPQQELDYIETLASKQVDGVILCGSHLESDQLSRVAATHKVAVVTSREPRGAAVVSILGEAGLHTITSHLISLGHRTVGHLGFWKESPHERSDGYRRALRENDLQVDGQKLVFIPELTIEGARKGAGQLLKQAPEITGITCFNDVLAVGALQACADMGRRVPDDIAVVGFDDIPLASLVTPALTTMRVPRYELGKMVMELLFRVMAADGTYEEQLEVQAELVIRDSCGARRTVSAPST